MNNYTIKDFFEDAIPEIYKDVNDFEKSILKNPSDCYQYAKYVLNGPFHLGEPTIAKLSSNAIYYAKYILKGRFKLFEPNVTKSVSYAYIKIIGFNHE